MKEIRLDYSSLNIEHDRCSLGFFIFFPYGCICSKFRNVVHVLFIYFAFIENALTKFDARNVIFLADFIEIGVFVIIDVNWSNLIIKEGIMRQNEELLHMFIKAVWRIIGNRVLANLYQMSTRKLMINTESLSMEETGTSMTITLSFKSLLPSTLPKIEK